MFIDSHCHLDFSEFNDLKLLLTDCEAVGVKGFLVPATTAKSWSNVMRIANDFSSIRAALGLHPYFLNEVTALEQELLELECRLSKGSVVAVGEIGLDKWPNMPDYEFQKKVLTAQLKLAQKFALPVIMHARKSEDDLLKIIRTTGFDGGGIVHAFNGSLEQAKRFIGYGFLLGIGGTVTYPRAQKARRVLQSLADEHFVLETDAPDMPLCGYQGQANSPIRIIEIAQSVAEIRQQSVAHVAQCTSANLQRVLPNWHKV